MWLPSDLFVTAVERERFLSNVFVRSAVEEQLGDVLVSYHYG